MAIQDAEKEPPEGGSSQSRPEEPRDDFSANDPESGFAEPRIPVPPEFPSNARDDSLAQKESTALGNGVDLERDAAERDHNRTEELRDLLKDASKGLFRIVVVVVEVAIIFWAWHLLLPKELAFLPDAQLDKIEHILQTILFSGLVAGYARKIMKSESK